MSTAVKRRNATRSDLIAIYGRLPSETVYAQVWEVDGRIAAIAGYWMYDGDQVVFSDIVEGVEAPAITIFRQAMAWLQDRITGTALCTAKDERAEKFLSRLGWLHLGPSEYGEVYGWGYDACQD